MIVWGGLILVFHGMFFVEKKSEWTFIAVVALLGFVLDSTLAALDILIFDTASLGYIPAWLLCLWVMFASTLNHSLAWLQSRLVLAALLGAIFGPVSYFSGTKLAPVMLAEPVFISIFTISLCWALLLPLLLMACQRIVKG